jgi:hypothetical protein
LLSRLTQTFPEDLAEAISLSDAVYAGALEADFLIGADEAEALEEVAAGAAADDGFDAGAMLLDGVLAAGAESGEAAMEESAFLLLFDFLGVVESAV